MNKIEGFLVLFAKLYFTDNNTDLDVNVNERTKGDQHSDM